MVHYNVSHGGGGGEGQGRREDLLQGEAKPASEASPQRGEIFGGSEPRPLRRAKFGRKMFFKGLTQKSVPINKVL